MSSIMAFMNRGIANVRTEFPAALDGGGFGKPPGRDHDFMNHWIVKQEPETYSWADFVKEGRAEWSDYETAAKLCDQLASLMATDEEGATGGAQLDVTSPSGTNRFHGRLSYLPARRPAAVRIHKLPSGLYENR